MQLREAKCSNAKVIRDQMRNSEAEIEEHVMQQNENPFLFPNLNTELPDWNDDSK